VAEAIIKLPVVLSRTCLSRSTWLTGVKRGIFPSPIKLSARSVGWLASDIERFLAERIAARDAEQAQ
jgi:prophage regulatory protein